MTGIGRHAHRSQSDSTVVPPVTADRSPPASRMTGADSPVMALSSTEAAPMTISPSAGICSFAVTKNQVNFFLRMAEFPPPRRYAEELGRSSAWWPLATRPSFSLWAFVSMLRGAQGVRLRLAAPLGEGLREVREQHRQPQHDRDGQDEAGCASDTPNSDNAKRPRWLKYTPSA